MTGKKGNEALWVLKTTHLNGSQELTYTFKMDQKKLVHLTLSPICYFQTALRQLIPVPEFHG